MERKRINLPENIYKGDILLLSQIVKTPGLVVVYDIDAILADSMKQVFQNYASRTGIVVVGHTIDRWNVLTHISKRHGLLEEVISTAEDDWYDPVVLIKAPIQPSAKKLVDLTIGYFGRENNYSLTARNPGLRSSTFQWFKQKLPLIPRDNILIREEGSEMEPEIFKVCEIRKLAKEAPWVIFIEDSTRYTKAVLESGPENCLVINVPLGHMTPDFEHKRMIVVGRYPHETQSVYPVYQLLKNAIEKTPKIA